MTTPQLTILVKTKENSCLKKLLWALATRPPKCSFELVVVGDVSDDVKHRQALKLFRSSLTYHWLGVDPAGVEKHVGLVSNHVRGELVASVDADVIPWGDCFDTLIRAGEGAAAKAVAASPLAVELMDDFGSNLDQFLVSRCESSKHVAQALRLITHDDWLGNHATMLHHVEDAVVISQGDGYGVFAEDQAYVYRESSRR